jgi:hypothetical protein
LEISGKMFNRPDYENEYNDVEMIMELVLKKSIFPKKNDSTNTVSVKINGVEVTTNKVGKPGRLVKRRKRE